ncbi:MAG TPA: PaaI family thioesterase [Vicinamibacterales bacterium]|jgi:uncharacterized protein (TIGR00369 family)
MDTPTHFQKLENMMHSAPIVKLTEARIAIRHGESEITLPVKREFFHSAGAMHGAMYFLALDNAAFFAVNSLVEDVFVLTTSFTTYLTRPVSEGQVRAVGRVVNQNKSQFLAESVLFDSTGREIGRATGLFVRSRIPLTGDIGYR